MKNSRRSFVRKLAGGALAAGFLPTTSASAQWKTLVLPWEKPAGSYSANDRIQVASIGMGIMGMSNSETALRIPGVELVAVCDLYNGRLDAAKERFGNHLVTTRNWEEIIARPDIDAVFVNTTDHWHDHQTIAALKAGKAVYCEKPMVQHISEGKAVIEAEKASGKTLQIGSQRASSIIIQKAKELLKQGVIGDLVAAEARYDRQSANGAWQYSIPTDASEKTIDWQGFLGDAPKIAYDPVRFFRWRNYRDYGTGVAGDLFVHLFTALHATLDSQGPNRVFSTGGLRYWKDGRDVPDVLMSLCDYPATATHPAFNLQIRVNFISGDGGGSYARLVGTEGTMELGWSDLTVIRNKMDPNPGFGGWDSYETFTKAQQKEYEKWYNAKYPKPTPQMSEPKELKFLTPEGYDEREQHHAHFFDCVRTGKKSVEDGRFGLQAAAPSLAANMSYFENRVINWDPVKLEVK